MLSLLGLWCECVATDSSWMDDVVVDLSQLSLSTYFFGVYHSHTANFHTRLQDFSVPPENHIVPRKRSNAEEREPT